MKNVKKGDKVWYANGSGYIYRYTVTYSYPDEKLVVLLRDGDVPFTVSKTEIYSSEGLCRKGNTARAKKKLQMQNDFFKGYMKRLNVPASKNP